MQSVMSFLLVALALCLSIFSPACQSPGGGTSAGVVASVAVGDTAACPTVLARYDGNTFAAWGSESYVAEMFVEQTGLPILLRTGAAGTALVRVREPKFQWEGKPGEPLPQEAAVLFRQTEVDAWRLSFAPPPAPAP